MPVLAKVFRSGNSQAVRLPKAFRLETEQVEITRDGDKLVLRPHRKEVQDPWASLKEAIALGLSDDFEAAVFDRSGEKENDDDGPIFP